MKFFQYLTMYNYVSLLALGICIYQRFRGIQSLKFLCLFLLIVNMVEVPLNYYLSSTYGTSQRMYSFFSFFCAAYYLFIYSEYFQKKMRSKKLFLGIWVWVILSLYVLFTTNEELMLVPYYVGLLFTLTLIIIYFYHILYVESYQDLRKHGLFYFTLGILFFSVSSLPVVFYVDVLVLDLKQSRFFMKLLQTSNIFLYSGYLGAVLCRKSY